MKVELKKPGKKKGTEKTGGRTKGTPNKSTAEIKELIRSTVDFEKLIKKLAALSESGSIPASRILFEYAYGRSVQLKAEAFDGEYAPGEVVITIVNSKEELKRLEAYEKRFNRN